MFSPSSSPASRRIQLLQQQLNSETKFVTSQREDARRLDKSTSLNNTHGCLQESYTVVLPEVLTPDGEWGVHRSRESPHRLVSRFPAPNEHIRTLHDNWECSVRKYREEPCLGSRTLKPNGKLGEYRWKSYSEAGEDRTALGSGLQNRGIKPGATVGLYSVNCEEWVLMDAACHAYSMVSVPLYDTLGPEAVRYICGHAELAAVACSFAVLPVMLQCLPQCPSVRLLVVYGARGRPLPYPPTERCELVEFEQLREEGRKNLQPHSPPGPEDIATICYTSGTTGVPKGAVLTHANLIANSAASAPTMDLGPGDRHMSYLPLAHIYERVSLVSVIYCGCAVGFYSGDVQTLLDDMAELQPTLFLSVPRLYNRIYDGVMAQVSSGSAVARALFRAAYASKKAALDAGDLSGGRMAPLWDRLVFSKIRAKLGGKVRMLATGASPISKEVFEFLRICFGTHVYEGYGMTETSCTISRTDPLDLETGHVGVPLTCNEIKLVDIPEMNYLSTDKPYPRGEICVRGPCVFKGYYKDEAQTAEVLDGNGWLHTGDVGTWLPGGRLKIIDRKKNIFKLSQGEYIAPEKIESVYQRCPYVAQAFVYGDSLKSQLVGIVVPDPEVLLPWAKGQGFPQNLEALCGNPAVIREVHQVRWHLVGMSKVGTFLSLSLSHEIIYF
uniref:Long-chain acyl-CoA synthetase n=1 Tax=Tetraselmis sp. GSL018 TaxID=582737 RepID=A0A061RWH7_9CHLO|eukprot:CAMPEP_0177617080 /NCGR_PEP_ID=MMETSP0419_2-20121207/24632_1 /TAXON_ID=582737 /ORGANISM="Tetraselmis sp., Strain GSL018" /LENGTH=667 /DNA_ID=CAMNT_0019115449 /DNA_START=45 /DNA_END=2048 /DNA_ORIENTATION=-